MSQHSKIIIFLFFTLAPLIFGSCNKNNDVIPDVRVDFYLNLNDPEFVNLISIGGHVIVTSQTNNIGSLAAGFDHNGIIVYTSDIGVFNAYDRTCPHDFTLDGSSIVVNVDFTLAICPQCSTYYALSAGGTPYSGPGRYPLKNYKTSFDGTNVRVWNK